MKTIATIIAGLVLSLVGILPASADTPHCVTAREFSRVHLGDSRAHVRRVFDVRGHRARLGNDPMTRFRACGGGAAWVEFEREDGRRVVEDKARRF